MVRQQSLRLELKEEMNSHGRKLPFPADMQPKLFDADNHLMLIRVGFHLADQAAGIDYVNRENSEEKSNHEGEGQIICEPKQGFQNCRMNKEIV